MTEHLMDKLNRLNARPCGLFEGQFDLANSETNEVLRVQGKGFLGAHPEGVDRGGYVPWWKDGGVEVYLYHDETWVVP